MQNDLIEQLRVWIWEQREKHGDDLVALSPAFDLVLNKIDDLQSQQSARTALENKGYE